MIAINESKNGQHVIECYKCHSQITYNSDDIYHNYILGYDNIICPICKTEIICCQNNLINELNKYHRK